MPNLGKIECINMDNVVMFIKNIGGYTHTIYIPSSKKISIENHGLNLNDFFEEKINLLEDMKRDSVLFLFDTLYETLNYIDKEKTFEGKDIYLSKDGNIIYKKLQTLYIGNMPITVFQKDYGEYSHNIYVDIEMIIHNIIKDFQYYVELLPETNKDLAIFLFHNSEKVINFLTEQSEAGKSYFLKKADKYIFIEQSLQKVNYI